MKLLASSLALLFCLGAPRQPEAKPVVIVRDFVIEGTDTAATRRSTDSLFRTIRADLSADTTMDWITIKPRETVPPSATFTLLLGANTLGDGLIAGWTIENRKLDPTLFWKDCMHVGAGGAVHWGHLIAGRTLEAIHANAHPEIARPRPPVVCS